MENIPRNLEKNVTKFTPPKFSERPGSWNFMLVGNHGQVIHLRWLRGMIYAGVFLLIAAIASAGCFYVLYRNTLEENRRLNAALNTLPSQQQVKPSPSEKKMVAENAPLIVAKTKTEDRPLRMPMKPPPKVIPAEPLPKTPAKASPKVPVEPSPKTPSETSSPQPKPEADVKVEEDEKPEVASVAPPAEEKVKSDKADDVKPAEVNATPEADGVKEEVVAVEKKVEEKKASVQPEKKPGAEVKDFKISYSKRRKTVYAQFVIKNTGPKSSRISGHAIVVLKSNKIRRSRWVTLPSVKLVSGKPSGKEIGKTFSIANFTTLTFSAKNQRSPKRFKTASVFIFAEAGKLMMKKDFPIEM